MSSNQMFSDMSKLCNEVIDTMRESKDKDELMTCRVAFSNLFVNFEQEFEKKLRNFDREQEKELEQLRAIKKLLSTTD